MRKRNETVRRMACGKLTFPSSWDEINPEAAISRNYIALCSDDQSRTAIFYSDVPAYMMSDATANEVIRMAQAIGLGKDTKIYGFIENNEINQSGAKLVRK